MLVGSLLSRGHVICHVSHTSPLPASRSISTHARRLACQQGNLHAPCASSCSLCLRACTHKDTSYEETSSMKKRTHGRERGARMAATVCGWPTTKAPRCVEACSRVVTLTIRGGVGCCITCRWCFAVLQQVFAVEFKVDNYHCLNCHKVATKIAWETVVQLRQRVDHKRTFYLLEQMILKHRYG